MKELLAKGIIPLLRDKPNKCALCGYGVPGGCAVMMECSKKRKSQAL